MTTASRPRRTPGRVPPRAQPAPRWRQDAPRQQRSRETMDRFAEAAEALLRERPFEAITVQEIVAAAGRPTGSFYARFGSKEALMPYLYQRYHEGLAPLLETRLAAVKWEVLDFAATCAGIVDLFLALYVERHWLLRAVFLFARQHPEALPPGLAEQRQELYARAAAVLLRHRARIRHENPEEAVRFGVFLISSVARDKLLFPDAPHASATPMEQAALRNALVRALRSYLGSNLQ